MASRGNQFSRWGIYIKDGILGTSICHASPGNEGRGECTHFSFAETSEEIQEKYLHYLTDRIGGSLTSDETDGTPGDYVNTFRNWLIQEKGFSSSSLKDPGVSGDLVSAWFHDDAQEYDRLIKEVTETSLMESLRTSEEVRRSAQSFVESGIPFRVVSTVGTRSTRDESVARDTAMWLRTNGIDPSSVTRDDGLMDSSSVTALASGSAQSDVHALEKEDIEFIPPSSDSAFVPENIDKRYVEDM